MSRIIFNNIANFIVILRTLLIFLIMILLSLESLWARMTGVLVLLITAFMDWLDGYVARKYLISSRVGGLLDTLGDRITENLLLVFFAYKQLIPLFVPLIFISRSFISDFIRYLNFQHGENTFSVNRSRLGLAFVASKTSRASYLTIKIAVFFLGAMILVMQGQTGTVLMILKSGIYYLSIAMVLFNLIRFVFLIYDSRAILAKEFIK